MDIDRKVAEVAAMQHSAVATRQIRALGGDHRLVHRRVRGGVWEEVTSRVIRIAGSPRTMEQALMIRVLHAGPGAMASHEAAAWLWGLPGFSSTTEIASSRHNGGPVAVAGHRSRLVLPHHRMIVRCVPTTSLPRTIFDLAGIPLPLGRMARLVDTVVTKSPAMLPALHRTLGELGCRGRDGITVMRLLLDERPVGTRVPASGLERQFERICDNAGIRGFERQIDFGGESWLGRADYRRADIGLIVEVDSELHHTSLTDRANDAARDAAAIAGGWRKVLRIPEEHVWRKPWLVVAALTQTIAELERPEAAA